MSEQKTDDDVKKAWKAYKKEFDGAVKKLNDTLDKLAADLEIRYAEINAAHEQMEKEQKEKEEDKKKHQEYSKNYVSASVTGAKFSATGLSLSLQGVSFSFAVTNSKNGGYGNEPCAVDCSNYLSYHSFFATEQRMAALALATAMSELENAVDARNNVGANNENDAFGQE